MVYLTGCPVSYHIHFVIDRYKMQNKIIIFNYIICTQVNRMSRSRRVLAIGGKHCDYGWTGSVFIHFYFL